MNCDRLKPIDPTIFNVEVYQCPLCSQEILSDIKLEAPNEE